MRAAVYTRISADVKGDEHGVNQQLGECRALADRLGWQIAETFSDNDISAYSGRRRPGYEALLDALETGRVGGVIAWHTDRLHRSLGDLERFIDICQRRNVSVQTCRAGSIDLGTASGQMVAGMLAVAARHEVAHMVERQKASHTRRAADGKYRGGRRPFGYRLGPNGTGLILDEREAAAIRDATTRILSGASMGSIVREWNTAGLRTSTGAEWKSTTVATRVLLRPRNAGLTEHKGKIIGRGEWPAIVGEDEWRALRALFDDPSRRSQHSRERRWQGANVYICGRCGASMKSAVTSQGKRQYKCEAMHLSREQAALDDYVDDLVIGRLSRPDAALVLEREDVDVDGLSARREELRSQKDELAALFADGSIDGSQLKVATAAIRSKLDAVDAELASARGRSPVADLILSHTKLADVWAQTPPDIRGKVIGHLMAVTVLPIPLGRRNAGFDPQYVRIDWTRGNE